MGTWIAAGDETGSWDIIDAKLETDFTGVAWVLGSFETWEVALQKPVGTLSAAEAFSQPIQDRLPKGAWLKESSDKYHVSDIYKTFRSKCIDIPLDVQQADPILELLRADAEWLLRDSGLGVLTVGGDRADARSAGLGLSGDGLRERARAFSGLMAVALPFLPGDADLILVPEARSESALADAVRPKFGDAPGTERYSEPFRDFQGRLNEDMQRIARRCAAFVINGKVTDTFYPKHSRVLEKYLAERRTVSFMQQNPNLATSAMNGIADLACALVPRPNSTGCRLTVPDSYSGNYWAGNYRDLRHVIAV